MASVDQKMPQKGHYHNSKSPITIKRILKQDLIKEKNVNCMELNKMNKFKNKTFKIINDTFNIR